MLPKFVNTAQCKSAIAYAVVCNVAKEYDVCNVALNMTD